MHEKKLYIDGKWIEARSGVMRDVLNPFNGKTIARVAEGDREDCRAAIDAARKAFDRGPWPRLPVADRAAFLSRLGEFVERDREELARLETLDTGKTLEESRWDMDDIAGIFRYYANLAVKDHDEVIESPIPNSTSRVVREPVGVCAQISPWNYPLLQASWKMAPALAAGCTMVMKPSELTPLSTIKITELAEEAGIPPGVVNTVLGPGDTVGAELAENPAVELVSFTGGIETGKKIMRAAAGNVKKIALELGGKNPHIIFADADFDIAIEHILNGALFHAGQICSAGSRVMVETPLRDRLVEALAARMESVVLGSGLDPETQMGPLISDHHRAKVERYVTLAREEGAKVLVGGTRPSDPSLRNGHFYLPTLVTGCTHDMRVAQEEIFGPVITIETFDTEDEAVGRANSTIYGLSAGFWTHDSGRIERVSRALRFGTIWINDFNIYFVQAPWGGYKQSGLGRELGFPGLEEYTELKHIYRNHAPQPMHWFGR